MIKKASIFRSWALLEGDGLEEGVQRELKWSPRGGQNRKKNDSREGPEVRLASQVGLETCPSGLGGVWECFFIILLTLCLCFPVFVGVCFLQTFWMHLCGFLGSGRPFDEFCFVIFRRIVRCFFTHFLVCFGCFGLFVALRPNCPFISASCFSTTRRPHLQK